MLLILSCHTTGMLVSLVGSGVSRGFARFVRCSVLRSSAPLSPVIHPLLQPRVRRRLHSITSVSSAPSNEQRIKNARDDRCNVRLLQPSLPLSTTQQQQQQQHGGRGDKLRATNLTPPPRLHCNAQAIAALLRHPSLATLHATHGSIDRLHCIASHISGTSDGGSIPLRIRPTHPFIAFHTPSNLSFTSPLASLSYLLFTNILLCRTTRPRFPVSSHTALIPLCPSLSSSLPLPLSLGLLIALTHCRARHARRRRGGRAEAAGRALLPHRASELQPAAVPRAGPQAYQPAQ